MDLNSDSDDSDSGADEPTCARSAAPEPGSSITRTPEGGGTWAGLEVGTRLLVRWESGWESGAVAEKVTPAMGGRAADGVTPATLYRIDYDDGESCLHDLETLSVRLESSAAAAGTTEAGEDHGEADTWAQCERCEKWRRLPPSSSSALPEHWFCELNPDRAFASCEVAEEPWLDDDDDQQAAPPHDRHDEVEVEAVWEVAEEDASSPRQLSSTTAPSSHSGFPPSGLAALVLASEAQDAPVHKKPCGRPPRGTDGLPMRWSGPKEMGRWVEQSEKPEKKSRTPDVVRRTVRCPVSA